MHGRLCTDPVVTEGVGSRRVNLGALLLKRGSGTRPVPGVSMVCPACLSVIMRGGAGRAPTGVVDGLLRESSYHRLQLELRKPGGQGRRNLAMSSSWLRVISPVPMDLEGARDDEASIPCYGQAVGCVVHPRRAGSCASGSVPPPDGGAARGDSLVSPDANDRHSYRSPRCGHPRCYPHGRCFDEAVPRANRETVAGMRRDGCRRVPFRDTRKFFGVFFCLVGEVAWLRLAAASRRCCCVDVAAVLMSLDLHRADAVCLVGRTEIAHTMAAAPVG